MADIIKNPEGRASEKEEWLAISDPKCVSKPSVGIKATLHQELPPQVIEVLEKNQLKIKLDKIHVNKLFDQIPGLVARDGCISAPSGPGC
jgi:hypothetical protein